MAAGERVAQLIEITKRLGRVIERETQLLRARRPSEIAPLQEEKLRLGAAYEEELGAVGRNRETLTHEAPQLMRELQAVVAWFRALLDEHGRVLAAARVVTERMVRHVSEEVARKDRPAQGYSKYAAKAPASRAGRPVSLAVNQVV